MVSIEYNLKNPIIKKNILGVYRNTVHNFLPTL